MKREEQGNSSGDEDVDLLPRKAFDVGDIPADFDPTLPPTSGLDYLRRVRLESMLCPPIVTANIQAELFSGKQTVRVDDSNGSTVAPPGFAPPGEWQEDQVWKFNKVRTNHYLYKKQMKKKFGKQTLPNIDQCKAWLRFCLGTKYTNTESAESSEMECSDGPEKEEESKGALKHGHQPLLRWLVWLIQPKVETLLAYHVKWLKKYGFSQHQGRWIYALLVCLEKPLTPNGCDILRSLVRACAAIRSELASKTDEFLMPLNLVICLVAHYFDQKDMMDT